MIEIAMSQPAKWTAAKEHLTFLWLEITGKCNLTCSHCYAESGPTGSLHGQMDIDAWFRVIEEGAQLGCRSIQFIGGEPTIHPELCSFISRAHECGYSMIEVYTNATRLDSVLIKAFRKNKVTIASSFYSNDPLTHERITGVRNSWRRTVDSFRLILEAGLPLRVGIIEMRENAGQTEETKRFLNAMGIMNIRIDRVRGVGRGEGQLIPLNTDEFGELCGQCWKGRLCVTHSGLVFPCVFARSFPLGDVRDGLSAIVNSSGLSNFRIGLRQSRSSRGAGHRVIAGSSGHGCAPDECNPDNECNPDCNPSADCAPTTCHPDTGSCDPNEPTECSPDK